MKNKTITFAVLIMLVSVSVSGQDFTGKQSLSEIEWNSRTITGGVVLKWAQTRLFDSDQAIYIIETDTTAGQFEFGVAAGDQRFVTSEYAAAEGVIAAINGTFFNMQEGYNVHYVRVNDSVVAFTDEKEYGIRATGVFTATGEAVDISAWGPEKEDAGMVKAEDAIVSGPLLTDNGKDISLDSINFNKNRHPRSLLGITGDGHVLFIAVDGRQPGYAEGMSLFELRELALNLGCTDILNLDGGGSTTLYVKGETASIGSDSRNEKGETANIGSDSINVKEENPSGGLVPLAGEPGFASGVVNRPSGKVERAVPSIVFVKEKDN